MDSCLKSMLQNKESVKEYYLKSLKKTYQQIFLENEILGKIVPTDFKPEVIVDVGCGGGTLTYHLNKIFTDSRFILIDYNPEAIEAAKEVNKDLVNAEFLCEDFLKSSIPNEVSDLTISMHSPLTTMSAGKKFLYKLLDITKKGGYFILSSLFNLEHDVDLYCKFIDHTRKGGFKLSYNTYSKITIDKWLKDKVEFYRIIPFEMPAPLEKMTRGIGSYTLELKDGRFLTISGGMLMQWGFLVGKK